MILAAASLPAAGWELDYRLDLRLEHASNVARRAEAIDDLIVSPRLSVALREEGDRLSLAAAGDIERRLYQRSGFADENLARIGLRGNWKILDERLGFAFEDAISEQPIDSFAADAPDNRQRVHVWTAGPTLSLRPSARSRISVELRGGASDAQRNREFNAQRSSLAARGLLELDTLSSLSTHVELGQVDFDLALGATPDYQRRNLFARYDRRLQSGELSLDAGWTEIDFERQAGQPARRLDEPLLRLRFGLQINPRLRLDARVQRQISDAAQDVLDAAPTPAQFEQTIAAADLRTTVVSSEVFTEQGASLGLVRSAASWSLAGLGYLREQRYQRAADLDQDLQGLSLTLGRQIRARQQVSLFAASEWRDFVTTGRDDRDLRYGLNWTFQRTRRLAFGVELSRSDRDSSDPAQRFEDERVLVTLSLRR